MLFTFVVLSPSFIKVKTKNEPVLMCELILTVTCTEWHLLNERALGNWNSPGLERGIWPTAMGLSNSELNNPCWPVVPKIVLGSCGLSYQTMFTIFSSFSKGWAHWNVHMSKVPACWATTENGWEIKRENQWESLIHVHVYAWSEIPLSVVTSGCDIYDFHTFLPCGSDG